MPRPLWVLGLVAAVILGMGACDKKKGTGGAGDDCPPLRGMAAYRYADQIALGDRCEQHRRGWLMGKLVAGSHRVRRGGGRPEHRFEVAHRGKRVPVRYRGLFPDQARPGIELLLRGRADPSGTYFTADRINARCPDRYRSKPPR